jgi:hypothetical protein
VNKGTNEVARAHALESVLVMSVICCPTPMPKMQLSLTANDDSESVTRKPQVECNAFEKKSNSQNCKLKMQTFSAEDPKAADCMVVGHRSIR